MDFPSLQNADLIAIDIETRDDDLMDLGIGTMREGYIAGVAVGALFPDGRITAHYYPVRHEGGGNLDRKTVWKYLNEELSTKIPKTGANLQYDLAYLWNEGVRVAGPFHDVQIAEPLIDENRRSYSLESIAQERLGTGKDESRMVAFIREHYGAKAGKEKSYIWRCPAHIVAPYACEDVRLPLQILVQQYKDIAAQELSRVWQVECELLPLLVRMHLTGVRVDVPGAQRLKNQWSQELLQLQSQLGDINARSTKQIADYLLSQGIEPPKTAKGNYSVTGKWIDSLENPPPLILAKQKATKYNTFLSTFIEGAIRHSVCGRIHGQFNQLKGDEYGTVTGRLSASRPNLQNIPNPEKDPYFAMACRSLYLPEHGEEWLRFDFSQIEYRLLIHFASTLPGGVADEARAMYLADPSTDFHLLCAQLIWGADADKLARKRAKNINFGLLYGMGVKKLAYSLGVDFATAQEIITLYHHRAPAARAFTTAATQRAGNRGWVKTLLGRRRRFDFWEPAAFVDEAFLEKHGPVTPTRDRAAAVEQWGRVKRAHTHASGNAILQGSSADLTKECMVEGGRRGVYDVLGVPLVTVHDELGFSYDPGRAEHREAAREMKDIMENHIKLAVPVLVSEGVGASWGTAG